jgi:ankyrin repeat protein
LVKELGAKVNEKGREEWSALFAASYVGYHGTVRYLVEELGADVNIRGNLGRTPLYLAASMGHLAVVRVLLDLGADINRSNNVGLIMTPLMAASLQKHHDVVKWLIKAGADTQSLLNNNATAASHSRDTRAPAAAEQSAYLEAKTHCSNTGCSGAGIKKCTGCKQARYCGEGCQPAHWKVHKVDCRRWSAELAAGHCT